MLTVTKNACEFADQRLTEAGAPEGTLVRIDLDKDGKGQMLLAQELGGDSKHEHDGKTVLAVSHQAGEQFAGKTLDIENTEKGPILVLK